MKPNPTKAEIDALEQELQEQREKQIKRDARAWFASLAALEVLAPERRFLLLLGWFS